MVTTSESAASEKADTLSSSNNGSGASTNATTTTEPAVTNGAGSSGISAQDQERLTKLGVLLVNVGAASEEKVFGVKTSSAMQTYRDHAMTDLLVINRKEDDAAAHPLTWYKPWTWWSSGPQVSPVVRVAATKPAPGMSPPPSSSSTATESTTVAASGTQTEEADIDLPPIVEPKVKPKKKLGLPVVDMRPLTDSEVAALTPAVQEDRTKMLKSEEHIHKTLQNIEDARYRYLVPSRDLHCEAEVVAVVRCYTERHQAAAAAAKASAAATDSAQVSAERSSTVRTELLACGPDVQRLKKCTEAMAMSYSHGGEAV